MIKRHSGRKAIEIPVGTRFGKLIVLGRADTKQKGAHWRCLCDCGEEKIVGSGNLRSGRTKSCGCGKHQSPDMIEKLRCHVRVTESGCWIYKGYKDCYPYMYIKGEMVLLTKAVYEHFRGPVPEGVEVCHNCPGGDNMACCNPAHLWLGTHAENMQDAMNKERTAREYRLPQTKLTNDDVRTIFREYHVAGKSGYSLAKRFGVGQMQVWRIVHRWRRCHITDPLAEELGIPRKGKDHA